MLEAATPDVVSPRGQPRHEVDHRDDDDQHERNDVGQLAVVTARHARRSDAGRDAADRDAAREDHRRAPVDAHAPRDPVGEEPDDGHDKAGLHQTEDARLHDVAEEDRGTEADDADLDVELALDRGLHPRGNVPHVADQQAEEHREEDRLETVVGHRGNLGHDLRQQRHGEDHDERRQQPPHRTAQQRHARIEDDEDDHEQQGDVVPGDLAHEGRGDAGQPVGDQQGQGQQRDRDPDDDPVLDTEFFKQGFHGWQGLFRMV